MGEGVAAPPPRPRAERQSVGRDAAGGKRPRNRRVLEALTAIAANSVPDVEAVFGSTYPAGADPCGADWGGLHGGCEDDADRHSARTSRGGGDPQGRTRFPPCLFWFVRGDRAACHHKRSGGSAPPKVAMAKPNISACSAERSGSERREANVFRGTPHWSDTDENSSQGSRRAKSSRARSLDR
jgi:hypothetical protein